MTIAHGYTLLLEAAALATSFAMLWLSFWLRDRHRQVTIPRLISPAISKMARIVGPLVLASAVSGTRLTIDLLSSDVQPASEKDEAILNRPEDAQHLYDKPQIQAEERQCA